ncbi:MULTISPECIES: SixA phosphatase family protein [unclassified Microbacterium]|uniref:SixA phosphatase family protein n=1 Tax=unclassified Microbacterium TaxID=2609290 RepID=UPI0006F528EC|nr:MULTISPECIES: histidine phosphatase family protein [unclassified Microbacterium]KQR86356.1 phosphohistidine phosphatase [Microbacterium sp. Leaf179]KQT71807.1 phosphohistidine phosphatase [Microbacterium sp. Leaf436]
MIQLILARHAKSDWADEGLDDHDRPLNDRGRRDAPAMARRVVRQGVRPEVLLSSTALRARQTAEAFGRAFEVDVVEQADLYLADPDHLLAAARAAGVDEVMVVAHDPGMSALVSRLADRDERMVTCAVAVFTWHEGTWDDVDATPPDEYELLTP